MNNAQSHAWRNTLAWATALLIMWTAVGVGLLGQPERAGADPAADPTTSRYVPNTTQGWFLEQGLYAADEWTVGGLVFAFGRPDYQSGSYGTRIIGSNEFANVADMRVAVSWFIDGYSNRREQWERVGLFPFPNDYLTIVIGTSNDGPTVSYAHGQAWAQSAQALQSYVNAYYPNAKIRVSGGVDLEPGFGTYSDAYNWVLGYNSVPNRPLYNFGSADGCWPSQFDYANVPVEAQPPPLGIGWVCDNGWTHDNIDTLSFQNAAGMAAGPLPEIYRQPLSSSYLSQNAWQWAKVSLWAVLFGRPRIQFAGSLSQSGACADVGGCSYSPPTDLSPQAAFAQLYAALYSDPVGRTAWTPNWWTDIRWHDNFDTKAGATEHVWTGSTVPMNQLAGKLPAAVSAVFGWNNATQQFNFWYRGFPDSFQTLTAGIQTSKAYMFQATGASDIHFPPSPSFAIPAQNSAFAIVAGANQTVWGGSNLATPSDINNVLSNPSVTAVFWWDNSGQQFRFWYRGFPDSFQTLKSMQKGASYFIQSSAVGTIFMN